MKNRMNTLQTIKNLHKKFPKMGVQEMLNILECVAEESVYEPPVIDTTLWYQSNPLYSKKGL